MPACGAGDAALVGRSRLHALVAEMPINVGAGSLWNLLAGYAGLVSAGPTGLCRLGAYACLYLTGVWNITCTWRSLLAGPFAGLLSIPVSFAVFRLRGA